MRITQAAFAHVFGDPSASAVSSSVPFNECGNFRRFDRSQSIEEKKKCPTQDGSNLTQHGAN